MADHLRVTRDGAVAVLTIDRPEKRNAITARMWQKDPLPPTTRKLAAGPCRGP